jgi:hypothetical protein
MKIEKPVKMKSIEMNAATCHCKCSTKTGKGHGTGR